MIVHLLMGLVIGIVVPAKFLEPVARLTEPSSLRTSIVQSRNSISGHVFDTSRRPVAQLYVELLDDVYSSLGRTRTDGSGYYSFRGMSAGTYKVKILPYGTDFVEQVQEVTLTNFTIGSGTNARTMGGDSAQLDFTLRAKANNSAATGATGVPGVIFVQEVPNAARKLYEKAIGEFDKKRDEAGLEQLKKAVEVFPGYYMALDRLGTEYVKREQFEPARDVLAKAVEVNPRSYSSLYALGFAQYNLKQIPAAVESLSRSVSLNPGSINSHLWMGIALRHTNRLNEAEVHLKRANDLGKSLVPEAHWQLALLYANQLKRYKEAADELELFLKVQPDARDTESIRKLIKQLRTKQ
ncbi:MAG: carboxypeptidase regulatory-like domain-containing protein [Pyrinomonadaceae bacterium]